MAELPIGKTDQAADLLHTVHNDSLLIHMPNSPRWRYRFPQGWLCRSGALSCHLCGVL